LPNAVPLVKAAVAARRNILESLEPDPGGTTKLVADLCGKMPI